MPSTDKVLRQRHSRKHYDANKQQVIDRARIHKANNAVRLREVIHTHLVANPCVDCGESDVVVLEFDHRPSEPKRFNISDSPRQGYSVATVLREIAKCDVCCANCHRRRTHKRRLAT